MRYGIVVVLLLAIGGGAYFVYARSNSDKPSSFRLEAVEKGDLIAAISATGTIEPEDTIDVGSQDTGPIIHLGTDRDNPEKAIDWCSRVEPNDVLAQIDPSKYKAALDVAKANLLQSRALLETAKANLHQRENDYKRAKSLFKTESIAAADYDQAEDNYETAKAAVGVAEANIEQTKAALNSAQIDLDYTTIKSPVKGVVVDRRITVGQTVVSAMATTSLFLLAKDLKRLQVWASVNEADIGQIHVGQLVTFTVDAFSGRVFKGVVSQIRLNATMTQNVVTYTVVVTTDNSDGTLLPYLTANLKFETARRTNVYTVPSIAVRWTPRKNQMVPEARVGGGHKGANSKKDDGGKGSKKDEAESPDGAATASKPASDGQIHGRIWIDDEGFARPMHVKIGISDGLRVEVSGSSLEKAMSEEKGLSVITGELRGEVATEDVTNPFAPKINFGKKAK